MEELFRPQPVYPHSVGQIIAHIGLMLHQVNLTFSPTSWQQVKACAEACVKFQLLSASYDPARHDNVLRVTKNHIDGICHMAGNQGKAKECASAIVQPSGRFRNPPATIDVLHCAQLLQRRFVTWQKPGRYYQRGRHGEVKGGIEDDDMIILPLKRASSSIYLLLVSGHRWGRTCILRTKRQSNR